MNRRFLLVRLAATALALVLGSTPLRARPRCGEIILTTRTSTQENRAARLASANFPARELHRGETACRRHSPEQHQSIRFSGVGEIRTHGTVSRSAVFKTAAFNHSATTPVTTYTSDASACNGYSVSQRTSNHSQRRAVRLPTVTASLAPVVQRPSNAYR
jgi:hypothetical protein